MKKIFAALIALFCVFALVSCGGSDGDKDEKQGNSDQSDTAQSGDDGSDSGSESDTGNSETSDTASSESGTVTDSNGNEISSGSASVSFSGTTKTISAAYLIDGVSVEITSGTYSSASGSSDQTVFLVVNGGSLTIKGSSSSHVKITKSGSAASGGQVDDNYNFYGINSGIVVAGSSSTAAIEYADITTSANGANAVVSTASATVSISNSTITSTGNAGARGLHATYGGTITADSVTITTNGASCASLATDRGGGTINASNMTLETNSAGSPLIYSTGTINVSNSTGSANGAQMVVVEGGSTAKVSGCDFSCSGNGNRTGTSESNSSSHTIDAGGIFIYQSMSGDAANGTDYFTAENSTLKVTTSGVPMFYVTNITAEITLDGNTFTSASESDYWLVAEETDQWGKSGSNGGKVTMTVTNQDLSGYSAFVGTSSSSLSISATDFSSTDINKTTGTW